MSVLPIARPFATESERVGHFPSVPVFGKGPVAYVCDREMRVANNRALFLAAELAADRNAPLVVLGVSDTSWSYGNFRHLATEAGSFAVMVPKLAERGVPLFPFFGDAAADRAAEFVGTLAPAALVFDFSPLAPQLALRKRLSEVGNCPAFEVDSRNAVPARTVTDKQEVAARTFRPKFWKKFVEPSSPLPFGEFPEVPVRYSCPAPESVESALENAECDRSVPPVASFVAGEDEARKKLADFVSLRLPAYAESRNDPNSGASSGLAAYFRNGNLAPEEVIAAVRASAASDESKDAFLEEYLVRRELSDNYCLRNSRYAELGGAPGWALETLAAHSADPRMPRYSESAFEAGETYDDLWNACQNELVTTGKIASYLRMYWAKKILEWSDSPAEAHRIALRLNDRYALDGRSPNGYVGVLWSIAGLHDRPWFEREVYGSIRYMNRNGCERKFDVPAYVAKWGK